MNHSVPSRSKSRRASALSGIALVATAALALTGCATTAADSAQDGKLKVVATTTQVKDFTSEVGGDSIELTGLLQPGASAHSFDPSPADLLALGEADVLVVNGAGLESFVDSAVNASGFKGKVVTASDGIDEAEAIAVSKEFEEGGHADEHGHEEAGAEEAAHAEEEAAHADEAAHAEEEAAGHDAESEEHADEHGELNPHIWTSPRMAQGMVDEIASGLGKADPDNAADFTERAKAYNTKLQDLDKWIAEQMESVPEADRVLVSGHNSLAYFLHDYSIEFAGSILPSFEDNAEPSAAEIDALVKEIKEQGVKAVFTESSMNPKLAQTIAKEAGVKVIDAESLYADSLGTADSGADTYINATIHNTELMLSAWGVKPTELPASLK
jgi:ABC-type Zn uptake system ZnuABC Zn-binding protein ZnuA